MNDKDLIQLIEERGEELGKHGERVRMTVAPKSERITMRFTMEEIRAVDGQCARLGIGRSTFIRMVLRQALGLATGEAAAQAPVDGDEQSPEDLYAETERLRRRIAEHPEDVPSLWALGTNLERAGHVEEAVTVYDHLAASLPTPDAVPLWMHIASVCSRVGDEGRAAAAYRRAAELSVARGFEEAASARTQQDRR